MTIANAWREVPGRGTAIASVWPAGTVTACGVPAAEPPALPPPMTVMSACAAVAGAVSTSPTVRPRAAGLPATTPCWVTGAAAAVNEPMPVPGTRTPAMTGTLEDNASPAADAPSELSANDDVAPAGASTGVEPNCGNLPCAVKATTRSCASTAPGTVTKSRAALLATVRPGTTR